MPYELAFTKAVDITHADRYFNECCIGGDVVSSALLPALQARYGELESGQEDWGWFLWAEKDGLRLAVDIFTDDPLAGRFRARLSTSRRSLLGRRKELETPALEELAQVVAGSLRGWLGSAPSVERVGGWNTRKRSLSIDCSWPAAGAQQSVRVNDSRIS